MRMGNGRAGALVLAVASALTLRIATGDAPDAAATVDGGGPKRSDCYVELDGVTATKGTRVDCMDGDPTCDRDNKCDGSCEFNVRACVNQSDVAGCSSPGLAGPPTVKGATLDPPPDLEGASCATSFSSVVVGTKPAKGKRKAKPKSLKLRLTAKASSGKPKVDHDTVTLRCLPRTGDCPSQCTCAGGAPKTLSFTTVVGTGGCGHLDADNAAAFLPLACAGLYFGGSGVAVPLPSKIPDMGVSIASATCVGNTLTLGPVDAASAGGNRCSGGSNHQQACTTDGDCPGGVCKLLQCTKQGCLFGAPLPIPNAHHGFAAASTCVINVVAADAAGTADCAAGTVTQLNLPLGSDLYLDGDLLANRCVGGTTPGVACGTTCGTTSACAGGGTCTNDTGRCVSNGNPCCADADCPGSTCETGACAGGANSGKGCTIDADCPGSTCTTFIQPCPICDSTTHVCEGGPNSGLACTPSDTPIDADFPTSHDCPPPGMKLGTLSIGFVLDTGTETKTAVDLPGQSNVFCGYCRNTTSNQFANPAVACTADADCAAVTNFTSCGQRTAGAFTTLDVARTIVETGAPAGALTTGGAGKPATLISVFCIPPSFSALVDSAADLPGPGSVALPGQIKLVP